MRYKVAIRFAIEGDLRFISHHDTMRLFERALARARLPVRFSEGFNPRPKMSLPLPRAVGIATEADVLVIELNEHCPANEVLDRLRRQMPAGLALQDAGSMEGKSTLQPEQVTYVVPLPSEQIDSVRDRLQTLLSADHWLIARSRPEQGPGRTIDLRGFLAEARVERDRLIFTAFVTGHGSLRPAEMLAAVGLEAQQWHHRVRRINIAWGGNTPAFSDSAGQLR